ncbi:NAD(P)/FAD-dependent oxidoreductase [Nesterenkonia xinjiangensis]|uniref:Thioredoxin reductase n=1 Tax=Nesterenkonia xinjiangensis TaxID=225327 RepID=A0A7Z0GIK2_9MICC|nr:NAD(P)/FAD-dependent oxidoreductase [Nesterenkonia xinjiangensis]NYJ76646.1 thioredoxin reductase [Nesterenkonia xinjiangensis]
MNSTPPPSSRHTVSASDPRPESGELYDAVVIGAGPAGLSAAVALGRARRRVLIIDAGSPRNRAASHLHTVLGHEGLDPAELLRTGRQEALSYGADLVPGVVARVSEASVESGPVTLTVTLEDGSQVLGRAVIAAGGLTDELPDVPGLAEHWGSSVLHCPYCHGWEVRDKRLGVLAAGPMALHQAELLRQWTDRLTFFSAGAEPLSEETTRRLRARSVAIEPAVVTAVHGEGGAVTAVALADGREVPVDAIFTAGALRPHDAPLEELGLARSATPMGEFLSVDRTGRTSHPRVWAVGNISDPAANVVMSMSAGTFAGATANMTLVSEDFDLAESISIPG